MKHPALFFAAPRRLFVAFVAAAAVLVPVASAQTYYNLAASDFTEDFAAIANTTTWATPSTGSWSGFAATSTVPATGLPDPTKTTTNSAAFITGSSGGIQRGSAQASPTTSLIFLSTGADNATATALDLLLNFTGRTAGTLGFDVATVFNSTGNRQGTLSVYASIDGTSWTPVVGTNLPYVATNNTAGSAAISVALPAMLNNQAQGRLRFYYHNNAGGTAPISGSRPKISIDNVLVTSTSSVAGLPVISSPTTATVTANSSFTYTIVASESPTSYGAAPLPAGLSIDGLTGTISGSPTTPGTYVITLSATNGTGTGQATLTLTVDIDPNAPVVTAGQTISAVLNTPVTPYQILASNSPTSYTSGALPAGLILDSGTGIISGTPTAAPSTGDTFTVSITAANASGTGTADISIVVGSPPVITSDLTASAYVNGAFAYTLFLKNQSHYPLNSVIWTGLPAAGLSDTSATNISGTPTATGTYTITIEASNDLGTTSETFTLVVIDQTTQDAIPTSVVINEFSNSTPDKIELLVVGDGTAGSTADLRGMTIKDFSGSIAVDNGGKYVFASNSLWSAVPAGTLIVLSNGTAETEDLVVSDFVLRVNLGNATYFTGVGTFDIATTEMVMIKAAGYGTFGVAGGIHALASGVSDPLPADTALLKQFRDFTGKKLSATGTTGTNIGVFAVNATSTLADFTGTGATGAVALASLTFGAANNATNQTYIDSLRTSPLSAVEAWRQSNFGTSANTGTAADSADFDSDGIANLIEYATGTNPTVPSANPVILGQSGGFLTLTFNRIDDSSLTYIILESNDLVAGFTPTGTSYSGTANDTVIYTDMVPLATPGVKRFLRLQVTY